MDISSNRIIQSLSYSILIIAALMLLCLPACTATQGPYAYVPNSDGNVSVIDTQANTITANATVGGRPYGAAVNPAGTRVYVTVPDAGNLSVIDTATNNVTTNIPVEGNPYGVAVNPAGTRVYVTCLESRNVTVIDANTNTVTALVPISRALGPFSADEWRASRQINPPGVTVNPEGTRVYVAGYRNNVSVIDATTNTLSAVVPVGRYPAGVAVNPAGTRVYVANSGDNNVSVIDTTTNTVSTSVPVGDTPLGIDVNPAGTRVYVANQFDDNVTVIDTTTNTPTASVWTGNTPCGLAVNPAGTRVYVAGLGMSRYESIATEASNYNLSVIDMGSNTVADNVTVGAATPGFGKFIGPPPAAPAPAPALQVPWNVGVLFNVRDDNYRPIEGALVSVGDQNATSNSFGSYLVLASGDNVTVNVTARGYANQSFPYLVSTGKTEPVTMLPPGSPTRTPKLIRLQDSARITTSPQLRPWQQETR